MLLYIILSSTLFVIILFLISAFERDKKQLKRNAAKAGWLLAIMMFMYRLGPLYLVRFLLNVYPLYKSFFNRAFHSQNNKYNINKKAMDEKEAKEILGVSDNPTHDEIQRAFNKLMKKVHPDVGGSKYLAEKIIEARKVLLKRSK